MAKRGSNDGAKGGATGGGKSGTKGGAKGASKGGAKTSGKGGGARDLKVRVKTAKGRRLSSTRWLERQLNDPYIAEAKRRGYRSRAAFKLVEIDDKLRFLVPGARVVDLGAAPGGWAQVTAERVNATGQKPGKKQGRVIAVDLQPVDSMPGVEILELDFLGEGADDRVREALGGAADVVLSDMAAPATGHRATDHMRIMALAEAAAAFACEVLAPGGVYVAKVLQGGTEGSLLTVLKQRFASVRHLKPPASRSDSAEMYVVATGFRPAETAEAAGEANE